LEPQVSPAARAVFVAEARLLILRGGRTRRVAVGKARGAAARYSDRKRLVDIRRKDAKIFT
jgi:hypothetical protein